MKEAMNAAHHAATEIERAHSQACTDNPVATITLRRLIQQQRAIHQELAELVTLLELEHHWPATSADPLLIRPATCSRCGSEKWNDHQEKEKPKKP